MKVFNPSCTIAFYSFLANNLIQYFCNQISFFLFKNFYFQGNKPFISLPKGKGIKLTIAEERDKRMAA